MKLLVSACLLGCACRYDGAAVPHPELAKGRRFLLIDDVLTTGSTMAACARCLMDAGAESVVCAVLAGAEK